MECQSLTRLSLHAPNVYRNLEKYSCKKVIRWPHLRELNIGTTFLADTDMKSVAEHCSKLEIFSSESPDMWTNALANNLIEKRCETLRDLRIVSHKLGFTFFCNLHVCRKLRSLKMPGSWLGIESLMSIAQLNNLEILEAIIDPYCAEEGSVELFQDKLQNFRYLNLVDPWACYWTIPKVLEFIGFFPQVILLKLEEVYSSQCHYDLRDLSQDVTSEIQDVFSHKCPKLRQICFKFKDLINRTFIHFTLPNPNWNLRTEAFPQRYLAVPRSDCPGRVEDSQARKSDCSMEVSRS